jgi:hypothetical protein
MLSLLDLQRSSRHFAALLLVVTVAGCGQQEKITSYRVKKPEVIDPTLVSAASTPAAPATEQQTLGLIVPIGDTSWFFKLTGDAKSVEPQQDAFLEFTKSIKFSGGADAQPSWTLPAGWKDLPGSQFRFATIRMAESDAAGKPLEISVSSAGGDMLANINRWRGQLNLKPIAATDLGDATKAVKVDGHDAIFVSLVGKGSGQMGGAPFAPFAGGGSGSGGKLPADHPPIDSVQSAPLAKAAPSGDLKYDAPPEWSPGKANAFSLAAFKVVDGDAQADITVSTAGGELLANVNRWRGQLSLPPIDAAELSKSIQKIETLGTTGAYVEIVGPEGAKRESILGVQAEAGGRTWFVKLKGDAKLAEQEKPRFEAFVKSLKTP